MPTYPVGIQVDLTATDKVPGQYIGTVFGVRGYPGPQDEYLLLIGEKAISGGTLTVDTQIAEVTSQADIATLTGNEGNVLARMANAVLRAAPGIKLKLCAPTITSGAAATATITVDGTWTVASGGPINIRVGNFPIDYSVGASDTPDTWTAALAAYINTLPQCPVTAAAAAGSGTTYIVTLTSKSYGTNGNNLIVWADSTYKPSGMTIVLGGGSAVASGGRRFTNGAGTINLTTLVDTTLDPERSFTIACSIIDATNLGRLETAVDRKAGVLVRLFEHVVVASTGTQAAATSLAQTTLDDVRFELVWSEEQETPAEEMAAWWAAYRHIREVSHPNQYYSGTRVPFRYQEAASKRPVRATLKAALDAGLTPIHYAGNNCFVTRAITTRSLTDAGAADDGTIDVGHARTPDRVNEELGRLWATITDPVDPAGYHYLRSSPAEGRESEVPAGVIHPRLWKQIVTRRLMEFESLKWITNVADNPPTVAMHPTASTPRFVFYCPVVPYPFPHQVEGTVAQQVFVPS